MALDFSSELRSSPKLRALRFERLAQVGLARLLRPFFGWGVWVFLLLFALAFVSRAVSERMQSALLGLVLLSFGLWALLLVLDRFASWLAATLPGRLTVQALGYVRKAKALANGRQLASSLLLFVILKERKDLRALLSRALLDPEGIMEKAQEELGDDAVTVVSSEEYAPDLQEAFRLAGEQERSVGTERLLFALAQTSPVFKEAVIAADLTPEDISHLLLWYGREQREKEERSRFWDLKNLRRRGGVAASWAAGETAALDRFARNVSGEAARLGFPEVVGHERELRDIARVLERQDVNNVLLVGQPGSGRRSMLTALAGAIALKTVSERLSTLRVMELDVPALLSQTQGTEGLERVLEDILREAEHAGNIILLIDEFHNFVGGGKDRAGAADLTGVIGRYLRSPELRVLAVTSFAGLHRRIETNPGVLSLFEKVEVEEIGEEEALEVLERRVGAAERRYRVAVSYPALLQIVELSSAYIQAVPFPKKALDLFDEALVLASQSGDKVLLPSHVREVVSSKTQIPVGEVAAQEKETLLNLESLIHRRLINQDEAVSEVASALRRARAEVSERSGPMGGFLFLGPTGVGKTETAKALAAIYFGDEKRIIRLDMSEFQSVQDIPRLLGTAQEPGLLTTPVREDPFSLVLLDEIEKAHPNILNVFLQVLDEGHVTDGLGRRVSFEHTIIIATSNAGYRIILQAIREKKNLAPVKEPLLNALFEEGTFRPEFINRFDAVVLFSPLSEDNLLDIADLMLGGLAENLRKQGIELMVTQALKERVVELGYNPTFGARNMRRAIQDKVENQLASALLEGRVKRGDRVGIDASTFEVSVVR